jgi:ABC-type multidrug transport system fused ATPase/permease subunit
MKSEESRDRYLKRSENFRLMETKEEIILWYLAALRFVTFAAGLALIWSGFAFKTVALFFLIPAVAFLFLYLLKLYSDHAEKKKFFGNLAAINLKEAEAVSGNFSTFEGGSLYDDATHDFSKDVDLFGNSSVFQFLNRTVTGFGRDILAGWLSDPYTLSAELILRQEVIRELAVKEKWRHEFMAYGMKKTVERDDIATLLTWMSENTIIKESSIFKFLIYFLPIISILSLFLLIFGILPYSVFTFIFLANLLFAAAGLKRINRIHNGLSRKYYFLFSLKELFEVFDNEIFKSSVLNKIKSNISGGDISAVTSVNKLSRLIQSFDSRLNLLVGLILNGLLLWDYHSVYRLEKWKSRYKNLFPFWLEMIGQIDAYVSLGNYANNNPDYVYPVISDKNIVFSAKKLGHQLIDESKRVDNDFTLERPGTVCIISGANMAGKSTFLRTVAVNFILGMTGVPVCAEEMIFIPSKLFTSMRTTDSLSNNESYFYAELKRLKVLKSMVEKGEPVLFILDEILKGTNSADKSLGSKLFMKRLIELGGTGLIATHDTSLGEMENDYPGIVINKCFEIEIDGEVIIFDYKLQDGITHKMNAAFLMKQMGILE